MMFDQAKLKEEIEKTWGPSGAHMVVFEDMEKRIAESEALIVQIEMYARINHDRPKDYKELCAEYRKDFPRLNP